MEKIMDRQCKMIDLPFFKNIATGWKMVYINQMRIRKFSLSFQMVKRNILIFLKIGSMIYKSRISQEK